MLALSFGNFSLRYHNIFNAFKSCLFLYFFKKIDFFILNYFFWCFISFINVKNKFLKIKKQTTLRSIKCVMIAQTEIFKRQKQIFKNKKYYFDVFSN